MLELFLILGLTLLNGFFSLSELALLSARRPKLMQEAEAGRRGAKAALKLLDNQSRLLSTVQVGVTVAGTLAGAYGGARVAEVYVEPWLAGIDALAPHKEGIALAIVVVAVSYLSLVLGELVPKRLALRSPERLSMVVAKPMQLVALVARPVVWFLTISTEGLLRLFGVKHEAPAMVSDDEIKMLLAEGQEAGVFEASETKMVSGALGLDDRDIASLMTPRPDLVWVDISAPIDRIRELIKASHHDRLLVADGSLDALLGVLHIRDLLEVPLTHDNLRALLHPPLVVPEVVSGLALLERFKEQATHHAIVVDEYGSLQGVVTLHDILEALVGELPTGKAGDESWVTRRDDGSLLVDGALPIAELKALIGLGDMPHEKDYRTVSGFIVRELRKIPVVGEHVDFEGWRFEVMDLDQHRIDKILVVRHAAPAAPERAP